MAQHDYSIANQGFPATRSDINNVLSAIATNNSGTSAPSTQYAGQFWIDTTSSTWTMYIHDGSDDIAFATIDTTANTVNFTDSALDVVTDTTPQLGGDLDLNSSDITGTGNINITGNITASGTLSATLPVSSLSGLTSFRNLIINGGMDIAQRGTSQASITSSGFYTVDRFQQTFTGTAGTWTQSQSTDVPSGQGFTSSLKMDCTTADASLSAGDSLRIQQKFEGQNLQYLKKGTSSAESLTLSFWVKSSKTGTYIAELYDNDNSRTISKSYTISSASTWEKKTITYAGDTTGAFDNDNALSLRLHFWLVAGSDFTSGTLQTSWGSQTNTNRVVGQVNLADSTSNEWYITGVQLEAGTTASDFEFLPYDVNLRRCLRYYFDTASAVNGEAGSGLGGAMIFKAFNSNEAAGYNVFPVPMRTNPTITVTDNSGTNGKMHRFASGDVGSNITFGNVSNTGITACNETSTFTTSEPNTYGGRIRANAEL